MEFNYFYFMKIDSNLIDWILTELNWFIGICFDLDLI